MSGECDQCGEHVMDCECFPRAVKCPFCGFPLKQSEKHADGWYWHPPRSRRDMNCPFSAKRDKHGFYNSFLVTKRHAITAGTRSAETGETPAPSEGCQSGAEGNRPHSVLVR